MQSSPTHKPRPIARAENVGSLLRPPRLLEAAATVFEPGHLAVYGEERSKDWSEFDRVAKEEIRRVVKRQTEIGLDVVSDGEFGRLHFVTSFHNAVEGFSSGPGRKFRNAAGEEVQVAEGHIVSGRLKKIDSTLKREAEFLREITEHPFKVTLPAASWFAAPATYREGITDLVYSSHEELLDDSIAIQRELIGEAITAGARYIQLDFPIYTALADAGARADMTAQGIDVDHVLDLALDADRRVIDDFPDDVTFALHICRGNFKSRWTYEGALDPVAERVFSLPYDAFSVEWEDAAREGDFSSLRFLPKGPVVILGIVSSKVAALEKLDDVLARIEQATQFTALEQLAISTQCGFASVADGNELTEDEQWRKLELVAAAADRVWGS